MEKRQLLSFLKKAIAGFERQDIFALKETANHAIKEASLASDRQLARLALIAYCLHKMSSKHHIVRHGRWTEIKHDILFVLEYNQLFLYALGHEHFPLPQSPKAFGVLNPCHVSC